MCLALRCCPFLRGRLRQRRRSPSSCHIVTPSRSAPAKTKDGTGSWSSLPSTVFHHDEVNTRLWANVQAKVETMDGCCRCSISNSSFVVTPASQHATTTASAATRPCPRRDDIDTASLSAFTRVEHPVYHSQKKRSSSDAETSNKLQCCTQTALWEFDGCRAIHNACLRRRDGHCVCAVDAVTCSSSSSSVISLWSLSSCRPHLVVAAHCSCIAATLVFKRETAVKRLILQVPLAYCFLKNFIQN